MLYLHNQNRHETTVETQLYVRVGTQKFGRRTERDVQVSENDLPYNAL